MTERRNDYSLLGFLKKNDMMLVLIALICFFTAFSPSFLTFMNLKNLILQNTHILVIVAGLSFVMVGGGIDLSIGYQISLVSVVMGLLFLADIPPLVTAFIGVLTGICCGAMNGWLVSFMGVLPFAATLVTQIIFRGVSSVTSSGRTFSQIPTPFRAITSGALLGIQIDIWIAVLCIGIVGFIFTYTYYGKHIKGMGENEKALQLAGIYVKRIKLICYMAAGAFYAIAAMILVSKQGIASSSNGPGMEITAIAAVYIGGVASYRGGSIGENVKITKLIIGVFIQAVIDNGIQLIGGAYYIQYIIIGGILLFSFVLKREKRLLSSER